MIEELAAQGLSRTEIRKQVQSVFGIDEIDAEFMIAIALGEIAGDVVEVDPDQPEESN
jgi:hypothetical protein